MNVVLWFIVIGLVLIAMTLGSSFVARLPLSAAMLYLAVGFGIGPHGLGLLRLDLRGDHAALELLTEIAVLISLFAAGFKLALPLGDPRWRIPLRLASVSMLLTVAGVTAVGVWGLGLPLGAAVLLGGILAPTDPVLASDVQVNDAGDRDRVRFGLTGEGGLNDGTAMPVILLGLGLLALHPLGAFGWRWWTVDVVWAIAGGLAIGYALGAATGQAVLHLRMRHRQAIGSDEFIGLGLIALAYGVAQLCHGNGFLAVFAAALALRRIETSATRAGMRRENDDLADAPAEMMNAVQGFNAQLERCAEVAVVLVVGALLATVRLDLQALWLVALLFAVIRPLSVVLGLTASSLKRRQRGLIAWFGIRGVGSVYYLSFAIGHGLAPPLAQRLASIVLTVVVASVIVHGISTTPLMARYERRKQSARPDDG